MPIEVLTSEPTEIRAGDTLSWLISVPSYPASSGWTLKYQFSSAAKSFNLSSTASDANHSVAATAATTAAYTAGSYQVLKYVESGSGPSLLRTTLGILYITVLPALHGSSTASDQRSHAKKVLDAIEAVIEGRASRSDAEYEVDTGGTRRRLKTMSIKDLLELRSHYLAIYTNEQKLADMKNGKSTGGRILMRL